MSAAPVVTITCDEVSVSGLLKLFRAVGPGVSVTIVVDDVCLLAALQAKIGDAGCVPAWTDEERKSRGIVVRPPDLCEQLENLRQENANLRRLLKERRP